MKVKPMPFFRTSTMSFCFFTFFLFSLSLSSGCKVYDSHITGKYFNKKTNDTLNLLANNTYEYEEKLNNGEHGWNTGNWNLTKNTVSFFNTTPLPLVGYKLRIIKVGISEEPLQLEFILNGSKKILQISEVHLFDKKNLVNASYTSPVSNKIIVKKNNSDSIAVKIPYFPLIGFNGNRFDKNGVYKVIVYPAERLYELDKLSYKYKNGSLINNSEKIRYKKLSAKSP